jgi:hypothetical protein
MNKPQPRPKYDFHELGVDDMKKFPIPHEDPTAGSRVLGAAYAYGRRNNQKFCGCAETQRGKMYMLIRRVK